VRFDQKVYIYILRFESPKIMKEKEKESDRDV
jgi:hypothetical protein